MKRRLKVLLSAYACEPDRGSEPGVGWNMALHLARSHDVWVLTRANNQASIERALSQQGIRGVQFLYYDLPPWASWWKRGSRGVQLYYYLWQCAAVPLLRAKDREIRFDIVHHVTFVKYWAPSALAWIQRPFVWGFVGGGDDTPRPFLRGAGWRAHCMERGRTSMRKLAAWDPLVRYTARRARVGIGVTSNTVSCLKRLGVSETRLRSQVGMSADEWTQMETLGSIKAERQVLFAGNLLFLKGVHLALRAFERAQLHDWRLRIVGDGPYRKTLEQLAHTLRIQDRVSFAGHLPRREVWMEMARSAFLVHPSLHDSGAYVCMEAAALSRAVICLDLAGPSLQVTESSGIRVPAQTPAQVISDLSTAMRRLAGDPNLCAQMGTAARRRVKDEYAWERHAGWFNDLYADIVRADQKEKNPPCRIG